VQYNAWHFVVVALFSPRTSNPDLKCCALKLVMEAL